MSSINYFKLLAKNFYRDFQTREKKDGTYVYSPRFFKDIDWIIVEYDINEEKFSLMNAQHIIAHMAGFGQWSELIHSSNERLEIGRLLVENRHQEFLLDKWETYQDRYLYDMDDASLLEFFKSHILN